MSSLWVCCCPSYLSYLTLPYWGFDKKEHTGHLIIRKSLAVDTQQIFQELYRAHFPIQTMKIYSDYPISKYAEANDTVGFYCRPEQNDEKHFSKHAYGIAIDINPLTNPYVYQGTVWPESASQYLKRDANIPGLITVDSVAFKIFTEHGYEWVVCGLANKIICTSRKFMAIIMSWKSYVI